ncbi:hypothetical protein B0T10DRAFT_466510 [Thelonectria olida]|uniref:MADS-box domain-containing protein n=1 Tax=Thelonectria olida TaxID=1576542 RepID=A0A9P9AKJ5_9HYPO|nr:hypothetical protein B0T10DRAFT_466510 [Thelonectria olida]
MTRQRQREAKNKDTKRGRRNCRGGIIKKCDTYRQVYGAEIVIFIRDADGYDGFESHPGLLQKFTSHFPREALQTPEDLLHNDMRPKTIPTFSAASSAASSALHSSPASSPPSAPASSPPSRQLRI